MGWLLGAYELQSNGNNANSGFFDASASYTSTLSTSNGTSATPIVTASNYTFVSTDIGNYLYLFGNSTWLHGWYRITSVNAGAATVDASVGSVSRHSQKISTTQGISSANSASSGTWSIDYSQNPSAARTYTDLTIVSNTNYIQSAAFPFSVNMIGNSVKISGGVNFTTGTYLITAISGTTAILERACGTVGSTNGTGKMGGAVVDYSTAIANSYAGGLVYYFLKGSSGIFNWSGIPGFAPAGPPTPNMVGYLNIRGDNGKAEIRLAANSTAFIASARQSVMNIIFNGQNNLSTIAAGNPNFTDENYVYNCDFKNLAVAINFPSGSHIYDCTFENCTSVSNGTVTSLRNSVVKNCGGSINNSEAIFGNLFINHSSTCLFSNNFATKVINNTFYNITGNAVDISFNYNATSAWRFLVENNIFSNVSGFAVRFHGSGSNAANHLQNNSFFACTNGFINVNIDRHNDGNYPVFTDKNNVALSVSPFVSAANLDFRLNNEIGGGRLCRGASRMQSFPLTATTSSLDIGAVQTTSYAADKTLGPLSKTVDMKANTTNYSEYINLASTGYTFNTATLKAYYVRPNLTATSISLASQTVSGTWVSGGFVEVDPINMPGLYRFDVPNEVIASGVSNSMLQVVNTANNDRVNINYKFFDSQILDLTQDVPTTNVDQTVGDAFNAARAYGFGKWAINGKNLEYYNSDGSVVIKTLGLDNPNYPKSRGFAETTDGLILDLRAYDLNSYSGSGNLWNDLSDSNYDCILYYNPTFVLDAGGAIQFNGSQIGVCEFGTNVTFTQFTYNIWVKITQNSAQWQSFINVNNDNFLLAVNNLGINSYNPTYYAGYNIPLNTWINVCQTYVQGTAPLIYVNGILIHTATSSNLSYTGQRFSIGAGVTNTVGPTADEFLYGRISEILIYNKRLSAIEIYNNYMAKKYRYGL